ncbi:hypothetical protein HYY70_02430 [Candidatus Woesearchaeota archaeon]|nr:hypothetical protein [Candidatus Woesearchaeota archaeon]
MLEAQVRAILQEQGWGYKHVDTVESMGSLSVLRGYSGLFRGDYRPEGIELRTPHGTRIVNFEHITGIRPAKNFKDGRETDHYHL